MPRRQQERKSRVQRRDRAVKMSGDAGSGEATGQPAGRSRGWGEGGADQGLLKEVRKKVCAGEVKGWTAVPLQAPLARAMGEGDHFGSGVFGQRNRVHRRP